MTRSAPNVTRLVSGAALLLLLALAAGAHVNSPHIYLEENVGPYPVILVVHMPPAVPGEADLQVLFQDLAEGETAEVAVRDIPPQGEQHAPDWREATVNEVDPNVQAVPIPLMLHGLWRAQVRIRGARGEGVTDIPIAARIPQPRELPRSTTIQLVALGVFLMITIANITWSMGRDSLRDPSEKASRRDVRRGLIWSGVAVAGLLAFLGWVGDFWWKYHRLHKIQAERTITAQLGLRNPPAQAGRSLELDFSLKGPRGRPIMNLAEDRGKLMHLTAVRMPGTSYLLHAHPRRVRPGVLQFRFTPPAGGRYLLFGDVLFPTGEAETVVSEIEVSDGPAPSVYDFEDPDDSQSFQPALGELRPGAERFDVGDGYAMRWVRNDPGPLAAGEFMRLTFELVGPDGGSVSAVEPYNGEAGLMILMREDAQVFARIRPAGTLGGREDAALPASTGGAPGAGGRVSFPYGFPEPGLYRLWVQMKHAGVVRTGVFDVEVG